MTSLAVDSASDVRGDHWFSVSGTGSVLDFGVKTNCNGVPFPRRLLSCHVVFQACRYLHSVCVFRCDVRIDVRHQLGMCYINLPPDAGVLLAFDVRHRVFCCFLGFRWAGSVASPWAFEGMSGSEPGEMAPKSSKAVVLPKFDMHVYTSELTSSELKSVIEEYSIPMNLHPRLPPLGMTIDRLPSWHIGLYIKQLEQGGLRVPFSSFFLAVVKHFGVHVSQLVPMGVNRVTIFEIRCMILDVRPTVSLFRVFYKLCKQGHWFYFENKTGRGTRKCFKEVTTSLKGWKKKFFLIDRRAIPDAMPWRHGDTDLHDDFRSSFDQDDVDRLSEFLVPLRLPPRHLLYMCGLTTVCRHPELSYNIKDQDKNVISIDIFLKLPTWTGTIVSKGDPIPEDQHPKPRVTLPLLEGSKIPELTAFQKSVEKPNAKIAAAREKKEKQSLARDEAKRAGVEKTGGLRKKRKATPEAVKGPAIVIAPEASKVIPLVENVVVNLSDTRASTPPAEIRQHSSLREQHDTHASPVINVHSPQSSHHGNEEAFMGNKYVPDWELRNDLRVCTFRACKELISHLATPAEEEAGLLKANQDNEEMTKKLTLLDNAHSECPSQEKELLDIVKEMERERDEWRATALDSPGGSEEASCFFPQYEWRATALGQVEQILHLEKDLEPKTQQLVTAKERVKMLEREKLALSAQLAQSDADRKNVVKEFIPAVVKRLHTSVEYRRNLAALVQLCFTAGWLGGLALGRTEEEVARFLSETQDLDIEGSKSWEERHQALFTTSYPYVQKVANSCDLPMGELWSVYPDAPPLEGAASGVAMEGTTQQPPLSNPEVILDVRDIEDILDVASKSQTKMKEKMNDPIAVAKKQNCWSINYNQINDLYDDFVPQKELSAEQKYFSSSFISADKTSNATPTIPTSMPKQVKPIVKELHVFFEAFKNRFQSDIKEMKDVFDSAESDLCEIKKQNEFLEDQLLEATIKHEVEISVFKGHECVDNSLHAEIEQIQRNSIEIQEGMQARIKVLEKDIQRCQKQSVDFE
ncbi:hypothetical protein Tco_1042065 [Tanacetum coccineum]|uniref:Transposase (putative) gypsy type domain-containing protein n=1 Tax=Tanacetum coccineum TaxID=301880 RepID=A0ABQ5GII7_9ASTR